MSAEGITAGIKLVSIAVLWAKKCQRNNEMFVDSPVRR